MGKSIAPGQSYFNRCFATLTLCCRTKDWLYGIRTAVPDKEVKQSIEQERLFPAERLRILYQLITSPMEEGGAGITPKKGEWINVESIFALHDYEFNRQWIAKWATSYVLKPEDLDEIRDKFGEKVAFYFAFVQAYFIALVGMAAFGVSAWAILGNFSAVYGIINSFLCVGFVEYWKQNHDAHLDKSLCICYENKFCIETWR